MISTERSKAPHNLSLSEEWWLLIEKMWVFIKFSPRVLCENFGKLFWKHLRIFLWKNCFSLVSYPKSIFSLRGSIWFTKQKFEKNLAVEDSLGGVSGTLRQKPLRRQVILCRPHLFPSPIYIILNKQGVNLFFIFFPVET